MSLTAILVAVFKFVAPGGTRRNETPSANMTSRSGPASVCSVKPPACSFDTTPMGRTGWEDEVAPEPCAKADTAQTTIRGRIVKPFLNASPFLWFGRLSLDSSFRRLVRLFFYFGTESATPKGGSPALPSPHLRPTARGHTPPKASLIYTNGMVEKLHEGCWTPILGTPFS